VLLVEDDDGIRQVCLWALEDQGFVVEEATDGRQALERASAHRPRLVILDMTLPVMSGDAVADGLRAVDPDLPILLITADGRAAEKAQRVGAYEYLRKPFDLDVLVAAVRRGLQS
jgi:DNA-binding response OmpR family regulator